MCRSGCPTKDHSSYAECLRSANVRVAYCDSANGMDYTRQRKWDNELAEYRQLKAEGSQPKGTTRYHIDNAKRASDATGSAYVA